MQVKIQSVKFDADKKLVDFIQAKVDKMERFIERAIAADVILKIDKDHDLGNKVATVKFDLPGADLVAERRSKSFEESVDQCLDAIKKQVEKIKEKDKHK